VAKKKENLPLWAVEINGAHWYDNPDTGEQHVDFSQELEWISDWMVVESPQVKVLTVESVNHGAIEFEFESRDRSDNHCNTFFLDLDNDVVVREITEEDSAELTGHDISLSAPDLVDLINFAICNTSETGDTPFGYLASRLEVRGLCDGETGRCYSLQVGIFEGPESPRRPIWVRTRDGLSWTQRENTDRWIDLVEEAGFGSEASDEEPEGIVEEDGPPLQRFLEISLPEPLEVSGD
jgi:hypothetical protein